MNTPTHARREDERRLAERAAQWLQALERGGRAERAAFAEWLKESPLHVREVLLMTAWDRALDRLDSDRQFDLDALMAASAGNVVALDVTQADAPSLPLPRGAGEGKNHRWMGAIAAGILVIAAAAWWFAFENSARYATAIGEQRAFELEDGSIVYLNTGSRVEVDFSSIARDIRLVEGEGLFKVQQEAKRPFRVHTDDVVIQAIGTQFNVRRISGGTRVAVIEGKVVAAREDGGNSVKLRAGEEASIATGKPIAKTAQADLDKAVAWRQRRLVFRKDTLADIAAEFNRYNRVPQIRVESAVLRAKRFNGVFDADDPESLLKYLAGDPQLTFEKDGDELLIRPRAE